jgi:hypothetical protein
MGYSSIPPTRTVYILDTPTGRHCSFLPWPGALPGSRATAEIETPTLTHLSDDGRCLWVDDLAPGIPEEIDAHLALRLAASGAHAFRVVSIDPPSTPTIP